MSHAAFAHAATRSAVAWRAAELDGSDLACRLSLSIFADRARVRGELRDDAEAGGFRVTRQDDVAELVDAELFDGGPAALSDIVLLDCPTVDGARLAALARLDLRAAQSGARLIVSTSPIALDDVFSCLDQSAARILVDPSRADRAMALGEARALAGRARVRELGDEDRLMMLRLAEQVGQLANRLDGFTSETGASPVLRAASTAFRFKAPSAEPGAVTAALGKPAGRAEPGKAALPDPRLVRRVIRQRQMRGRFLDTDLFADPAWDMLLDLTAATGEEARVSVTSLCIASGVPPTTALRWIGQMIEGGLLDRSEDRTDRRRAFLALSDRAREAMSAYFAEITDGALALA